MAVGQGFANGGKGMAPHDYGLVKGELFEAFEVIGQMPGQGASMPSGQGDPSLEQAEFSQGNKQLRNKAK